MSHIIRFGALAAFSSLLAACSGGGSLSLSSASKQPEKTSPFVRMDQGGSALLVEQGKTATTGVHGWVSVQSVAQGTIASSSGVKAVLANKKNPKR